MKLIFKRFAAFMFALMAIHGVVGEVQAQTTPSRSAMPESTIKLPEFFGIYVVLKNGSTILLENPITQLNTPPARSLPDNVEFLIYGKDLDPAVYSLLQVPTTQPKTHPQGAQNQNGFDWGSFVQEAADRPAQYMAAMSLVPIGSKAAKLLIKPVSNQPQMFRLIPAGYLPDGVYQFGKLEKTWYRFFVGASPPQTGDAGTTTGVSTGAGAVNSAKHKAPVESAEAKIAREELTRNVVKEKGGILTKAGFATNITLGNMTPSRATELLSSWAQKPAPNNGFSWAGETLGGDGCRIHHEFRGGYLLFDTVTMSELKESGNNSIKLSVVVVPVASLGKPDSRLSAEQSVNEVVQICNVLLRAGAQVVRQETGSATRPTATGQAGNESTQQGYTPPNAPAVRIICPAGTIGKFTHGTRCTGFYDSDGLVDVQLTGMTSTVPFERTKELVHPGMDIVAAEGSPIYPIRDGVVVDLIGDETDRNWKTLGYMVMVEHDNSGAAPAKHYSLYLHMKQKPSVSIADVVVAGKTELGLVGHTGAAYGNHTHVEVRTFKERFNPTWKNIYGKLTPEAEKTFDEKTFADCWVDPAKFAIP